MFWLRNKNIKFSLRLTKVLHEKISCMLICEMSMKVNCILFGLDVFSNDENSQAKTWRHTNVARRSLRRHYVDLTFRVSRVLSKLLTGMQEYIKALLTSTLAL